MPAFEKERKFRPYYELAAEAIEFFAQRWGGLDDQIFEQALKRSTGRDRLVAIFALGHSQNPQASDMLAPFLTSTDFLERYDAGCMLGFRQDERAFSTIEEYLLADAPTQEIEVAGRGLIRRVVPEAEIWFNFYRSWIVRLLATWGSTSMTLVLYTAFSKIWKSELQQWRPDYITIDALLYILGRREEFPILDDIEFSANHLRLAMIFLSLGALHADERFDDIVMEMIMNQGLKQEVVAFCTTRFGLSEEEA